MGNEQIFDISPLSQFSNEKEYLLLPGVHLYLRGFNCYLWNARYHVSCKMVAKLVGNINFICKCGWLMKQSDTLKIWHRKWVVLQQFNSNY